MTQFHSLSIAKYTATSTECFKNSIGLQGLVYVKSLWRIQNLITSARAIATEKFMSIQALKYIHKSWFAVWNIWLYEWFTAYHMFALWIKRKICIILYYRVNVCALSIKITYMMGVEHLKRYYRGFIFAREKFKHVSISPFCTFMRVSHA